MNWSSRKNKNKNPCFLTTKTREHQILYLALPPLFSASFSSMRRIGRIWGFEFWRAGTMKRSGLRFWIPLLLLLLFIVHFTDAVESDPNGATTLASKNEDGTDLKLAPPVTETAEEEKKTKEETKEAREKDDETKETLIKKKKDEPLEEPEPERKNEKERLNGDSQVEECDPANSCVDDKSTFVACLRVPGKDSLDLSLLIQNKRKGSLDVNIVAPDFVILEQNTVHLKAKENKEVKISVKDGGNDTVIALKAGEGSCSLNFQNMVSDSVKKSESTALPGYFNHLSARSSFILIILAAAVLIGLAWSFVKFRRLKSQEGSPKYQQLDVGLPVSTGGKKDVNESDGWDNSWGDDWDVEEAPMTPSKPVLTPSAKGLASRKFNKDSWKD